MKPSIFLLIIMVACNSEDSKNRQIEYDSTVVSNDTEIFKKPDIRQLDSVAKKIMPQMAICYIAYKNHNSFGEHYYSKGVGFISGGRFFITCAHVFKPEDSLQVKSIIIYYNLQWNDKYRYDSVLVDLNYKAIRPQYDFKQTGVDYTDRKRDIIILKLKQDIPSIKLNFMGGPIPLKERVYGIGVGEKGVYLESGIKYLTITDPSDSTVRSPVVLGTLKKGVSGSPIFNSKGEILGMWQFGWDQYDSVKSAIEPILPGNLINEIKGGYKRGLTLNSGMSIEYMYSHYGKGYLYN